MADVNPRGGRDIESIYHLTRSLVIPALGAWFRFHIQGIDNVPKKGPAILALNHISYLDPLAAAYAVDRAGRRPRFLAKAELFDDRRIAWVLKGTGQILVRRGTRDAPMALDHALGALARGEVVVVFPEGTVTTDPELKPMRPKSGTARLALQSGAPLIPAAVWGTANVWPKGRYSKRWWPPRQDILMRIGQPLHIDGAAASTEAWDAAGRELMDAIGELVASLKPLLPDRRQALAL
jgi:1-acyl-sn-glycerol-3-phosphate acyltransferase